jgi:hypothetical protein
MRNRHFPIIIVCLSFLFGFALYEFGARFYLLSYRAFRPVEAGWTDFHSELGWAPRPGATVQWGDVLIRVDHRGARKSLRDGTPEIFVLGDSFSFGAQVASQKVWPSLLEKHLGRPVVNFSVEGYGVDQMLARGLMHLDQQPPKLIILGVIEDNFYRTGLKRWTTGQSRPQYGVRGGQIVLLEEATEPYEHGKLFVDWPSILSFDRLWSLRPYDHLSQLNRSKSLYRSAANHSLALLFAFHQILKSHQIQFKILLLAGNFDNFELRDRLGNVSDQLIDCTGVYEVDAHVFLATHTRGHPNELGHDAYLRCLLDHLELREGQFRF